MISIQLKIPFHDIFRQKHGSFNIFLQNLIILRNYIFSILFEYICHISFLSEFKDNVNNTVKYSWVKQILGSITNPLIFANIIHTFVFFKNNNHEGPKHPIPKRCSELSTGFGHFGPYQIQSARFAKKKKHLDISSSQFESFFFKRVDLPKGPEGLGSEVTNGSKLFSIQELR